MSFSLWDFKNPVQNLKLKTIKTILGPSKRFWRKGEIMELLREYRVIQGGIDKQSGPASPHKSKVSAKLVGQTNPAFRFVSESLT